MISLIVTTRNRPDFLYRCLLAIQDQLLKDFECIVVGDRCLFAEKVMRYFPQFRFINNWDIEEKNVGATGKNIGIRAAKYDLIAYCDDDNILFPIHLAVMAESIKDHDFIFTEFIEHQFGFQDAYKVLTESNGIWGGPYSHPASKPGVKDALTLCHTKDIWKKAGEWQPWEKIGYNEDGDFIRRLHEVSSNFSVVKQDTAVYNHSEKNFTDYENGLFKIARKNKTFVYPELIKKWTNQRKK